MILTIFTKMEINQARSEFTFIELSIIIEAI